MQPSFQQPKFAFSVYQVSVTHSDDAGKLLSFSRISSAVFVQAKGFGVPVVIVDVTLNGVFQFDHGFEDRQGYRIP